MKKLLSEFIALLKSVFCRKKPSFRAKLPPSAQLEYDKIMRLIAPETKVEQPSVDPVTAPEDLPKSEEKKPRSPRKKKELPEAQQVARSTKLGKRRGRKPKEK